MSADPLAAVRAHVAADVDVDTLVDGRVWGVELGRGEVPSMPRANVVLTLSGRVPSEGDNSYLQIGRVRLDVRAYGANPYEAMQVYLSRGA
jgi:hypothetical protein